MKTNSVAIEKVVRTEQRVAKRVDTKNNTLVKMIGWDKSELHNRKT